MTQPISWYASQYIDRFKWELVPLPAGQKYPTADNWGENTLATSQAAVAHYTANPNQGVGIVLGKSNMCSLDIDCEESFQALLAEFGLPAEDLDQYPCIEGRGRRIMFRVPDGVDLPYCKLNWPAEGDPTGEKHKDLMKQALQAKNEGRTDDEKRIREEAKQFSRYTVVELRSCLSTEAKQRQDVLPPTIHPDTGKPYKWIVQPPKSGDWPTPPDWLIAVWSAWSAFKPQFVDACPWAEKKPEPQRPAQPAKPNTGGSVIDAYIQATPLTQALSNYGYTKKGSRWLSPHSGTGIPGIHMYSDGIRCYIHHASDPLCSEENGQPVNAFDLFRYYEHNDDVKAAVKAAAELLGLQTKRQQPAPPMPTAPVQAEPEPELTPVEQIERDGDAQHQHSPEFQCLGYNGNYIYVLPRRSEQVARLSYGSLTKTALLQIACLEWWGAEFPKKDGVDWEMAVNTVLRWCENKGIYDARNERGRGAWYDGGRPVLHLGTSLIIDGKHKAISEHHSRYIYTKQAALENAFDAAPVGDAEAKRLADIFERLNWSRKEHGLLALGWTVLAPVCGALSWRPHLWLTAQRGAGKSWVQSYVMKPVIGEETLVYCQGGTTEAGIRQALKHDARPVMFDEAESEDASAARRMQSVLELARQSSSDTGAEIVKGTANGDGMSFNIRAMFMLGSINVGLRQAADESRFSVVSLSRPSKEAGEAERFAEFERHVLSTLTPEYCAGIRSRTYHAIPVIRKNTKIMAQAVAEELGSQRMGDQIGTLLAGAYSLLSSELITLAQAKEYIKGMNFDEAGEAEEVSDEHNCLNAILQRQVRVDFSGHGSMTKSIGELVDDCYNLPLTETKEERLTLGRHGLRVEGDELWVANSHAELTKTLRDTPWGSGHKRMLMRITGAVSSDKTSKFAGSGSRYVSIPITEVG